MADKQKIQRIIFIFCFIIGLSMITLVLLFAPGIRNFEYYVKILCVAILWFIFITGFLGLSKLGNLNIIPPGIDKFIIIAILILFELLLIAGIIALFLQMKIILGLIVSLMAWGLFNALRDYIKIQKKNIKPKLRK